LPRDWALASAEMPEELTNLVLITIHPEHVSQIALRRINTLLIVGREPHLIMQEFGKEIEKETPDVPTEDLARGEALFWSIEENRVVRVKTEPPRHEHFRHRRKYAEGELEEERTFHFRGPGDKLDLRAQNLNIFVQIAEGIDAETWQFHRHRGDYSNWLRHAVKDPELADQVHAIESDHSLSDRDSRNQIKEAILQKYTAPE
jgi:hypothetical protein